MNEPRSKRRLSLAARQLMLSNVARREAMAALADAVGEETRSTQLADRSRELLTDYSRRNEVQNGLSLRQNIGFAGRLYEVADQAEKARKDAADQAQWQVETLASAETRASRYKDKMDEAKRDLERIKMSRDAEPGGQMARKLQSANRKAEDI